MLAIMSTKKLSIPFAVAFAIVGASLTFGASPVMAQEVSGVYQPINCDFDTIDCIDVGESRLLRTDGGISINIVTTDLRNAHAYTVWWIVFNHPEECADYPGPCGPADLSNSDVNATVQWGTGDVAGESGAVSFIAHLNEGETTPGGPVFDLPGDGDGLEDADEAEVHVIVRSHGPVVPVVLNEQITSFFGGCDVDVADELPEGVENEPRVPVDVGECGDVQFAVHRPTDDDDDDDD